MTNVATSVFPVGNVIIKDVGGCTVAGSFSASLQLTNNHVAPVFNTTDTANLCL